MTPPNDYASPDAKIYTPTAQLKPATPKMIPERLSHYEIVEKLGEGGMGIVYKGHDARLHRFVAIKVLSADAASDPEHRRRFMREAQSASALNHPGIVTIHDVAEEGGRQLIVMEFVEGETLDDVLQSRRLRLAEILDYGIQAASALSKAHSIGLVHRDLKPSNMMITSSGVLKILDFGLAKQIAASTEVFIADETETGMPGSGLLTQAGRVIGTPAYMSPEQVEGKQLDHRSDIFSFGVVLYEMVTGRRPFRGDSSVSTMSAILTQEPSAPRNIVSQLPRELERVILRCLRKDPAKRIQVMADVVVELNEIKNEIGAQTPVLPASNRTRVRNWLAAAAVALAVAGGAAWLKWPKAAAPQPMSIKPLTSFPGSEYFPSFSPDGKQIAFSWSGERNDNEDVYVMQVGSPTALRLTTDPARDSTPSWSPDGSLIVFSRRLSEGVGIYVVPPLGSAERKVAHVSVVPTQISWAPDGKHVIADVSVDKATDDVLLIPIEGGEPQIILSKQKSQGRHRYPAVSPAGDQLAYAYVDTALGPGWHVYVVALTADFRPTGNPRRLTEQPSEMYGLTWADEKEALYVAGYFAGDLWRVSTLGGPPRRVLHGVTAFVPTVSRTGNRMVFARANTDIDLWRFDGPGPPVPFASSSEIDYDAHFSPDGKRLSFASRRSGDVPSGSPTPMERRRYG